MPLYRKKPVQVEARQWTGQNLDFIWEMTRELFDVLDDEDRAQCRDPNATAQVYDRLHSTWVLVYDGDFIIQGVLGEFYPCRQSVFQATYESVGA